MYAVILPLQQWNSTTHIAGAPSPPPPDEAMNKTWQTEGGSLVLRMCSVRAEDVQRAVAMAFSS